MSRRLVVVGAFTFVILVVGIVSVATENWRWAIAAEVLILIWFGLEFALTRIGRKSGGASTP
jgi:hypothetical protein